MFAGSNIRVRIIIYNCILIVLSIKSLEKNMELYKKGCFFLYLFLSFKITQINWMYSKILLNVYFIQFFLLSEYLYDNILQ